MTNAVLPSKNCISHTQVNNLIKKNFTFELIIYDYAF